MKIIENTIQGLTAIGMIFVIVTVVNDRNNVEERIEELEKRNAELNNILDTQEFLFDKFFNEDAQSDKEIFIRLDRINETLMECTNGR